MSWSHKGLCVLFLIGLMWLVSVFSPKSELADRVSTIATPTFVLSAEMVAQNALWTNANYVKSQPTAVPVASNWDCGSFSFDRVSDTYRKFFPADALDRVNQKISTVDRIAREQNVPTLALLFIWWKEGAKGTNWATWRASLQNTAHNSDGIVGMTDDHYKSDLLAYAPGVLVTDVAFEVQIRDAAKVIQQKAKDTVLIFKNKGYLNYNDDPLEYSVLLAVEAYNKTTYRKYGQSSPYIDGNEGYKVYISIMRSIWVACR
jgi:hypothetical protein